MKRENKIILALILIFLFVTVSVCIYLVINRNKSGLDAIKFRNEYMVLNDKINEEVNKPYINVNISDTNTVKYLKEKDAVEFLQKGTGVIYFGDEYSPWCRTLVPILTSVAEEKNEKIYYLNTYNIHSKYEIGNNKLNKIKEGSTSYYKILDLLDDYLGNVYLSDEYGNKYSASEKKLSSPTILAIKDGIITSFHEGTVESQKNGYDKLNDEEIRELTNTIEKLINSKNTIEACTMNKC